MQLLTRREMMELLGVRAATLWRRERAGLIPPAIRQPGVAPRWIRDEVEDALRAAPREVPLSRDKPLGRPRGAKTKN